MNNNSEAVQSLQQTQHNNDFQSFDPQKEMQKKKRKRTVKKWTVRGVIVVLLLGAGIFTRQFFVKKQEAEIEKTQTAVVARRTIINTLSGTGTLEPTNSYTVNALVKGEILQAPFEEGDIIEKDSLMFKIDDSKLNSSIERAEFNVERVQNSYDELLKSLEDMTLYSDYSGTVGQLDLEVGDKIGSNTIIAKITDNETMVCKASFFEQDANSFNVGDEAVLYFDGGQETLTGSVKKISALSYVNDMGSAVKDVEISVSNPGSITEQSFATVSINGIACYEGGGFTYNVSENIVSKASGEIAQLLIKEGQKINKGDLVLVLDSDSVNTQIKNSELSLKDAKSSLQSTIDQKEDYEITAPISGTVVEKKYEAGEVIDATSGGSTLAVIYDMSALKFTLNVDELDIVDIALGQQVTVTSDAFEGQTYSGEVTKISVQGSSVNGTTSYPVTVTVKETGSLMPGMNIDAEIVIEKKENVICVPASAISRGNKVKLVVKDEKENQNNTQVNAQDNTQESQEILTMPDGTRYKEVVIEAGINDDNYVEILKGLNEDDEVIVTMEASSSFSFFGISGGGMGDMAAMGGGAPGGMNGARPSGMSGGARPGGR